MIQNEVTPIHLIPFINSLAAIQKHTFHRCTIAFPLLFDSDNRRNMQ